MKVNKPLVDHLAKLSKLHFNEEEAGQIMNDLNDMLAFVEKIDELDLSNVAPLIYVREEIRPLREDAVQSGISREEALSNAPLKDSDYIKVPKVIKQQHE